MNKRFAIFDMDGTLVDSMVYWQQLGREYLLSKGVTGNLDDVMERIKPMTITESSALFIQEFGIPGTPESVAAEMNGIMDDHYRQDILLKPDVRQYLDVLHRSGVRMCVASATAEYLVRACLGRLGVAQYFEFLLSCETVNAGKDRSDIYYAAAEKLGARPEEIAVYEDAVYAARTAKHAGFYVVGVYDGSAAKRWEELKNLADEVIEKWAVDIG